MYKDMLQDYTRKSISEVIEDINRRYFLPDIQRNFVWRHDQVYALFDSIMRDYPINTFLFWRLEGKYLKDEKIKKLKFVDTSQEANKEDTSIDPSREYLLVLDGQQRLTTFYLVLKGNYIHRNNPYDLYFNILSGEEEGEDDLLYEFKFFNKKKGKSFIEEVEDDEKRKLWYCVKDIYAIQNSFAEIKNISESIKNEYSIELTDKHQDGIARLRDKLKNEQLIYYYPETVQDYDRILDIFVRTNSGGTELTYSDLLFSTIKSKWIDAREKFDDLLAKINKEHYRFTNDFILKTTLLLYATTTQELLYKVKNFRPNIIETLKKDWEKISDATTLVFDLLDRFYLTSEKTIPSHNALIPIVYWIFKNDIKGIGEEKNCVSEAQIGAIRVWLINTLLSGIFGGQSDTVLYKCKEAIDENGGKEFPAEAIKNKIRNETKKFGEVMSEDIDRISYNSKDSYLVLSICYGGAINFMPRMKGNTPEQDHIFSRDELKKAHISEERINSIYNIRYIGGTENKIKSKTPFKEWRKSIGANEAELTKHLIPAGDWSVENFEEFLQARKQLIEKALQLKIKA